MKRPIVYDHDDAHFQSAEMSARHRHVATLGQGGSSAQMDALPPPQRPTCNFFYTLIFHHQCH